MFQKKKKMQKIMRNVTLIVFEQNTPSHKSVDEKERVGTPPPSRRIVHPTKSCPNKIKVVQLLLSTECTIRTAFLNLFSFAYPLLYRHYLTDPQMSTWSYFFLLLAFSYTITAQQL
jgi:hypothetical protein